MRMNVIKVVGAMLLCIVTTTTYADIQINIAPADTVKSIYEQEEDGVLPVDTVKKTRRNLTSQGKDSLNAMKYTLDTRYLAEGHDFTKRWDDHLFIEGGAGVSKLVTYAKDYEFAPLTTVHLAVGKQFSRLHSARLALHSEFGYLKGKESFMLRYGARLDHLFSLSSYFRGYNPARTLDVSTVIGVGYQMTHMHGGSATEGSANLRLGAQLRFFTGPHGYMAIEPYYELSTDNSDLSGYRNFRRVDMSFGASLSYIYYINNNLSRQARENYFKNLKARGYNNFAVDKKTGDSIPALWRKPWFVELSNGINFVESPVYSRTQALGSDVTVSVGKWLSPALAVRGSVSMRTGRWMNHKTEAHEPNQTPAYETEYNSVYAGGRVDAIFNPFGLSEKFDWDNPFGLYLVAGFEMGRMIKYEHGTNLNCRSEAYTGGVHLWTKISDGVQLFVEPRYTHYVYKIPYRNVDWSKRYNDNGINVNIGLTVNTLGTTFRKSKAPKLAVPTEFKDYLKRLEIGLGGGVNFSQRTSYMKGDSKFGFGGQLFASYKFNHVSAARLAFEYTTISGSTVESFYDLNMSMPEDNYAPVVRSGQWKHTNGLGLLSLSYQANMGNLFYGYNPNRRIELNAFVGPTLIFRMNTTSELNDNERLQAGHDARLVQARETDMTWGVHGGLKLNYKLSDNFGVYFSPTIYVPRFRNFTGVNMLRARFFETINLGVQYQF